MAQEIAGVSENKIRESLDNSDDFRAFCAEVKKTGDGSPEIYAEVIDAIKDGKSLLVMLSCPSGLFWPVVITI